MKNALLFIFLLLSTISLIGQSRISFGVGAGDFASTDLAIDQEGGIIYDDCVVPTGHMFLKEAYLAYSYTLPIKLEIGAKLKIAEGNREYTDRGTQSRELETLRSYKIDLLGSYFFVDNDRIRLGAGAGPALMYRQLNSSTETSLTMINGGQHEVFAQTVLNENQNQYEFRGGLSVNLNAQFPLTRHLYFDLNLSGSAFCDMETLEESTSHTGSFGIGYSF